MAKFCGMIGFAETKEVRPGVWDEVIEEKGPYYERDAVNFRDGVPVLFHRRNRCPWLVTMRLEGWLKMYRLKNG